MKPGAKGFTLLEVIISISLLSLIMVAIVTAMRTLGNTKTTLEKVTNRVDEVRVVSDFLRQNLGAAMPVVRTGASANEFEQAANYGTYFAGNSSRITWVSPLLAGANLGGAYVMSLSLNGDKLQLFWQPYQRDAGLFKPSELKPRVLLHSVEKFEVGYLPRHGAEWADQWVGDRVNPVAVRLNIKVGDKHWPELVIRLNGAALNEK